jgi:hypothetical protein
LLGAHIAATATRQAAELAQVEARADREEARRARFADRIRGAAAELIDVGNHLLSAVNRQVVTRRADPAGRPAVVAFDPERLAAITQELRFLVRRADTLEAVSAYSQAVLDLAGLAVVSSVAGVYHVAVLREEDDRGFEGAKAATFRASVQLEAAIARDLGTRGEP